VEVVEVGSNAFIFIFYFELERGPQSPVYGPAFLLVARGTGHRPLIYNIQLSVPVFASTQTSRTGAACSACVVSQCAMRSSRIVGRAEPSGTRAFVLHVQK